MYYTSWDEATEFCKKISRKDRKTYRLPTEAEWEYACRAGTTTRFYYGDDPGYALLGDYAWYSDNSDETHPVGQKTPNAWGLHDMHGNVWEWCADWYASDYYTYTDSLDPQGPDTGSHRVLRGGDWYGIARDCRSARRGLFNPGATGISIGFRVVVAVGGLE